MHDDYFEHYHNLSPDADGDDIEGLEMFSLKSVGIDIGSSTSHLVFSRLTLRREGILLSGRFQVTDREVLYRSPIMLTPYLSGTLIDMDRVRTFIRESYGNAGLEPGDVDTGAVIITGEALKKENAQPLVEFFAKYSGKFICAAAGHNHEALLAAYGSGAVDLSRSERANVLNVDMGGGTTKFSLIENGSVNQTAAISVGARLIAFDENGVITRIEAPGRQILAELGFQAELGRRIGPAEQEAFAAALSRTVMEMITQGPQSPLAQQLMVTEPLQNYRGLEQIDYIVFSGGVSEHVYDRDRTFHGDVGPLLGRNIRNCLRELPQKGLLRETSGGIRATVIGAGEYTIQASGNTSYISAPAALPVFGLKVVRVTLRRGCSVRDTIYQALAKFDRPAFTAGLVLSLALSDRVDYPALREVAEGIAEVLDNSTDTRCPLYLTMDLDLAKSLGSIMKEELRLTREIIAVDGIDVSDLDYIDIGESLGCTEVIPVTVKSLMFPHTGER